MFGRQSRAPPKSDAIWQEHDLRARGWFLTGDSGSPRSHGGTLRAAIREVALIVLGVLIALSLESAWQDRSERLRERALLTSLRDEFAKNADVLDRWLELHQRVAASAEAFLAYLDEVPEGSQVAVPDSLLGELARTPTFNPELNSLDAALSSGQISLIRSAEIQRAIASWSRLLADAQEQEQRGAGQAYGEFLPILEDATSIGPAISWLVSDDRRLMRGTSNGYRPTTSSAVTARRRLSNALWLRYRLAESAASELQILRTGLEEVLALLEQELRLPAALQQDPTGHDVRDSTQVWVDSVVSPQYFAVLVTEIDRSAQWYRPAFGLANAGGSQAADGSWRIMNLKDEDLLVELIRDDRAQEVDRARGVFRVGFQVADVTRSNLLRRWGPRSHGSELRPPAAST